MFAPENPEQGPRGYAWNADKHPDAMEPCGLSTCERQGRDIYRPADVGRADGCHPSVGGCHGSPTARREERDGWADDRREELQASGAVSRDVFSRLLPIERLP